ncbi:MAG: glycosyl hydrolase family 28-related protein [Kiritimatiellae bacterium]|nr:glycosyl hydrolase family 28-related protein [Kiritimatiellia bacterium]
MNLWQAMWKMTWIATTLTLGANALAASTTPQKEKRVELVFNRRAVSAPPDITKIPKTVSVLTFGASGDGVQDDAAAIQRALDSDAATVAIPAGTYRIGQTLLVGSGTTVQADAQAVIRLADGAGTNVNTFLISNRHPVRGDKNIVVAGGIWDGNNAHNTRGADGDMSGYTGTAINFINVTNLALRSLTVRNPDAFSIRVGEVEDFLIEDITLDHSVIRPNQDGVHVGGFSKRGIIRRIKAIHPNTPNDDMIALNADDDVLRVLNLGMKLGPITDILVDDVQAEGAYNFVRLLSNGSLINNITVRNVTGSCRTYAVNINRWRFAIGAGEIHNVLLENFDVTKTAGVDLALIYITLNIDNLHILDFQRIDTPDAVPAATLYLSNGLENILEDGEGNQQSVSTYTLPSGNIPDLWINRQP